MRQDVEPLGRTSGGRGQVKVVAKSLSVLVDSLHVLQGSIKGVTIDSV